MSRLSNFTKIHLNSRFYVLQSIDIIINIITTTTIHCCTFSHNHKCTNQGEGGPIILVTPMGSLPPPPF